MVRIILKWISIALVVLIVAAVARFYWFLNTASSNSQEQVVFETPPGDSLNAIAQKLEERGLITSSNLFKIYAYFNNGEKLFKAGEYGLKPVFTPVKIYSILTLGKTLLYDLTVPEGYNIYQIAELLEERSPGSRDEFLRLVKDPAVIRKFGFEGRSLEGYLFPSTYRFSKQTEKEKVIKMMVSKFREIFTEEFEKRARELGYTRHQIVTMASIVEKETGNPKERVRIASVFHNRLKKKMRLESDPTVIYGIENFNGNLTREDLKQWSPYNTYRVFGLPEGPIASPGFEALKAVLWPEKTNYLFFVSRNDGTHMFSKSFREHQKEVYKFQKVRENRRGKSWRDLHREK